MRIRQHNGFGHGLEPGRNQDINCPSCKQEREANIEPTIEGDDDWPFSVILTGTETPQAEFTITLEPLDDQSGVDENDVYAFTSWLTDVLNTYDGPFRIETDF